MKIGRLLELHKRHAHKNSLPLNWGDGYLYSKNSIFRSIRNAAIADGFTFSFEPNADYSALPLSQLNTFIENKTIPYLDNVSVLTKVETKLPNVTLWDDVVDNLKQNHVFHETCHAVARSTIANTLKNDTILPLMIEESFANACELLGIVAAEDTAHRLFYESNSYIFMLEERSLLKALILDFGMEKAVQFVILFYLYSNYLRESLSDQDIEQITQLINVDRSLIKNPKILRSISKIAFQLNPRFRNITTVFYLRLCGFPITTKQLRDIDLFEQLKAQPDLAIALTRLGQLLRNENVSG